MTFKLFLVTSFLILSTVPLSACGIKPKSLDALAGVENDSFPRTYPTK